MKRPVKLGIASLKALSALVVLGTVAHAGVPYLPQIGPPPLRVAVVKAPPLNLITFKETPAVAATNSPAVAEAKAAVVATNAFNLTAPVAPGPFVIETPDQSLGDAFAASVFAMPTPDLLGISPQMLATYFRPVQGGTNFFAPNDPFHVVFMPPLPPLVPVLVPDKSSHAEYIVK
jgi:hypothetical protein